MSDGTNPVGNYNYPQYDYNTNYDYSAYTNGTYTDAYNSNVPTATNAVDNTAYNAYYSYGQYPNYYYPSYYPTQPYPPTRSVVTYDDQPAPVEKKEKIVNEVFEKPKFCCFRTLKSTMAVAQHEKLHVKCPTCDFMCLPSILQEHEETFHGKPPKESKKPSRPDGVIPAYAPKIETPEELALWIEARKKNWPTKTNVERKDKELQEKIERGEIVPKRRKLNPQPEPKLPSLVSASYESDSDDTMDPEKDAVTSKDPSVMGKILLPEDRPKRKCKYFFMHGKCKKGEDCIFSHEKPDQKKPKQPRVVQPIRKRPNLLYKLLEKDIVQEKSVILQCLRFIVDKNFFDQSVILEANTHE